MEDKNSQKLGDGSVAKKPKFFVRIANTDILGNKQVYFALTKIKGVGIMFANYICYSCGIDKTTKTGTLSDKEIDKLNEVLANISKHPIPDWLKNRRRDPYSGEDIHLIKSDLDFTKSNDLKMMMKAKSYKGSRHSSGLPVRGQRTSSNFRRTKSKGGSGLGVKRKSK